jgi:hypothetical protein
LLMWPILMDRVQMVFPTPAVPERVAPASRQSKWAGPANRARLGDAKQRNDVASKSNVERQKHERRRR